MMLKNAGLSLLLLSVLILWASSSSAFGSSTLSSTSPWESKIGYQYTYGSYSDSSSKESSHSHGLQLNFSYLEQYSVFASAEKKLISYSEDLGESEQTEYSLAGRYHHYSDYLTGRLTLGTDVISIDDDSESDENSVNIISSSVNYMPHNKSYSAGMNLAYSEYPEQLSVNQVTITVGKSFFSGSDWLQIRHFLTSPTNTSSSNSDKDKNKDRHAVELLWKHWSGPSSFMGINSLFFSAMTGERIYGVDLDAHTAYNLGDIQKETYKAGLQWNLEQSLEMSILGGITNFESDTDQSDYSQNFIYLNLSNKW